MKLINWLIKSIVINLELRLLEPLQWKALWYRPENEAKETSHQPMAPVICAIRLRRQVESYATAVIEDWRAYAATSAMKLTKQLYQQLRLVAWRTAEFWWQRLHIDSLQTKNPLERRISAWGRQCMPWMSRYAN